MNCSTSSPSSPAYSTSWRGRQGVLTGQQQVAHRPELALPRRRPRWPRRPAGRAGARRAAAGAARRSGRRCSRRAARAPPPPPGRSRGTPGRRTRRSVTGASTGPRMWSRSGSTGSVRSVSAGTAPYMRAVAQPRRQQPPPPGRPARTRGPPAPSRPAPRSSPPRAGRRSKASAAISSETVKVAPVLAAPPATAPQPTDGCSRPRVMARTSQAVTSMPSGLPTTKPSTMPQVIRECSASSKASAAQRDPGVGQREDRHDHVAGPGVEQVLQPLVGGDREPQAELGLAGQLGRRLLPEGAEPLAGRLQRVRLDRVRVQQQAQREAEHQRVHAGLEQEGPDRDGQQRVGDAVPAPGEHPGRDDAEQRDRDQQRPQADVLAVEERDHQQGGDVVHHEHGEQEGAQPSGRLGAQQREHAERERGVGRDGHAPAVRRVRARR